MRSLVTSILLYACELCTFTAELQRRIQAAADAQLKNRRFDAKCAKGLKRVFFVCLFVCLNIKESSTV